MAFSAVILTDSADYDMVRDLVGVSSTELPDATIDFFPYLPTAESIVKARYSDYATVVAATDTDAYYQLKTATQLITAARLAELRYAARVGDEVTREQVLTESWQYRTGPDWHALAERLAKEANRMLVRVETNGDYDNASILTAGKQAGPTEYRRTQASARTQIEWLTLVLAPSVDPYSPLIRPA